MAARKPEQSKPVVPVTRKPELSRPVEGVVVPFTTHADGTLVITGTVKTFYFRHSPVRFLRGVRHDLFTRSERTLADALESPAFSEVKLVFSREYSRYLQLRLGPVTEELRKKNDSRYRLLLNRYGDADFGTFALDDMELAQRKGVFVVFVQGKLCYLADCHTSFGDLVDRSFGNIRPDQCYLDGNETACRINSLVTAFKDTPILFFHVLEDDAVIDAATNDIRQRYLGVPAT